MFSPAPRTSGIENRLKRIEDQQCVVIKMLSGLVETISKETTSRTKRGQNRINVPHNIRVIYFMLKCMNTIFYGGLREKFEVEKW